MQDASSSSGTPSEVLEENARLARVGDARVGEKCLVSLSKLWTGDVVYADLQEAEVALRALLLGDFVFDSTSRIIRHAAHFDNRLSGKRVPEALPEDLREIVSTQGRVRAGVDLPTHLEVEAQDYIDRRLEALFEQAGKCNLMKGFQYFLFILFVVEGFSPDHCARRFSAFSLRDALMFLDDSPIAKSCD